MLKNMSKFLLVTIVLISSLPSYAVHIVNKTANTIKVSYLDSISGNELAFDPVYVQPEKEHSLSDIRLVTIQTLDKEFTFDQLTDKTRIYFDNENTIIENNQSIITEQGSFMANIWDETITINPYLAKQLIEAQTTLAVTSLKSFGEGWDNIAYLVNNEYVFRFPRREMGVDCMENEIMILPNIKKHITFPISCPQYIGKQSTQYPAPFAGYKLLPGIPLCDIKLDLSDENRIAITLATWLKELHAIPVLKEHISNLKGEQSWRYNTVEKLENSKERIAQYEQYFVDAGFTKKDLFLAIEKLANREHDHVEKKFYIHGDLYSRHLLVNNNKDLSGIIDWGDIHIGNPGSDLSVGYMIFSDEALQLFFTTYGNVTQEMKDVALVRALYHPIALLPYCYEKNEEQLKQWTILALKSALKQILGTNI